MAKVGDRPRKGRSDPQRRAKVNAAIRHAETVARNTGTTKPIIFRPGSPGEKDTPKPSPPPLNPMLREALIQALGIPQSPAAHTPSKPRATPKSQPIPPATKPSNDMGRKTPTIREWRPKRVEITVPPETDAKKLASKAREANRQRAAAQIANEGPKPASKKKPKAKKKVVEPRKSAAQILTEDAKERRLKIEAGWARNKAARGEGDARLAHNAAIKAKAATDQDDRQQRGAETFARLLREWRQYVVVHEMAHLKQRSHDDQFWQFLGTLCPDFARSKTWLDARGGELSSQWLEVGRMVPKDR